jgi:hypothetical protein
MVTACCFAASTASGAATLRPPSSGEGLGVSAAFIDSSLPAAAARQVQAQQLTEEWGGRTVATDGEPVTIFFSDSYPADPALQLKWADFMTSLIHGPELSTVAIHMAPLAEVKRTCGLSALACYSDRTHTIVVPGENPDFETSIEGALAHEYGHHVAASRLNPPFETVDYGTKRWATYENICAKATAGSLYPGAEDTAHYTLNPGEAFAESYRVLNEQRLGIGVEPWDIVTSTLYPDATALSLLEQDITTPWTANTTTTLAAALTSKVRTRTLTISTPLDGTLKVSPRQTGKATVKTSLLDGNSVVGTSAFKRASGASLSTTVCGQRRYKVRVQLAGTVTKTTKTNVSLIVSTA